MKININKKSLLKALGVSSGLFAVVIFIVWAAHHAPWAIVILLFILSVLFFYRVINSW